MITQHGSTALHQCVHLELQCTTLQHYRSVHLEKQCTTLQHYRSVHLEKQCTTLQHYRSDLQRYINQNLHGHTANSASAHAISSRCDNPLMNWVIPCIVVDMIQLITLGTHTYEFDCSSDRHACM